MLRPLPVLMLLAAGASAIAARQNIPVTSPLAASPAGVAAGQTLFSQLCQSCHGPAGEGAGDRGPALNSGTFTHGGLPAPTVQPRRAAAAPRAVV